MKEDVSSRTFEILLNEIGQFGFYQKRIYFVINFLQTACVSVLMYTAFACYKPVMECQEKKNRLDIDINTDNVHQNVSAEHNSSQCPNVPCSFSYTSIVTEWNLMCDKDVVKYVDYMQTGGLLFGVLFGAFLADLFGRKKIMFINFGLALVAHGLGGLSTYWQIFAAVRFLVGTFAGGFFVISFVLPLEFLGQDWRDVCACLGLWTLGLSSTALQAYFIRDWRNLAFVSGAVGLPLLGTYFIIPESTRWLQCRQRFAHAEAAIREMVSCNEKTVQGITALCDKARVYVSSHTHAKKHTYTDLCHSREMTKWTFVNMYIWMVAAIVRCRLADLGSSLTGNRFIDAFLTYFVDLPIIFTAIIINKCVGRRWCLFLYAMASAFSLFCVLVLHATADPREINAFKKGIAVFGKLGVSASLTLVCLITMEMYPTVVRCMGLASGFASGIIGTVLAQQLDFMHDLFYTIPYVVYGAMMVTVGFMGLLYPNTFRKPLPDILRCRHRTPQQIVPEDRNPPRESTWNRDA